jgi:hypothetical protein
VHSLSLGPPTCPGLQVVHSLFVRLVHVAGLIAARVWSVHKLVDLFLLIACRPQGLCHVVDFRGLRPNIPTHTFARPCVPFSGPSLLQDMPHRYTYSACWGYPRCRSAAIKGKGCFTGCRVYLDAVCSDIGVTPNTAQLLSRIKVALLAAEFVRMRFALQHTACAVADVLPHKSLNAGDTSS